ncbi:hypothetical protein LOK49_LG12G01708 [Camellia lanceoleosa]|uniref:Uncharacterized protein n=1 Tax=Camellia lanceoleosa TaxID=1840588 RepID=A0ACC0FSX3_9ERIC|nr:hypothetical protein LOK49_LG12G01708 [Camellia lanceoleosa]
MAACGSLQHIFEKPKPENLTLLESLSSWKHLKSSKPIEDSSFTEIFGELHFKENPESSPSSTTTLPLSSSSSTLSSSSSLSSLSLKAIVENLDNEGSTKSQTSDYYSRKQYVGCHKNSDSFSSMNSDSLQLCTEGLGFESSDDVDLKTDMGSNDWQSQDDRMCIAKNSLNELRRSRRCGRIFPPPISSIGKSGKPWVSFKSYRHDGRFVLKEIRIPDNELLHARREDGRLILQFCQSDDEILDEDEDEEEEEKSDFDGDNSNVKEDEICAGKDVDIKTNVDGGDDSDLYK